METFMGVCRREGKVGRREVFLNTTNQAYHFSTDTTEAFLVAHPELGNCIGLKKKTLKETQSSEIIRGPLKHRK